MSKRKNARYLRAKKEIKKMRIGLNRLIRITQEQRGRDSEELGQKMVQELLQEGKILDFARVERCSWMDSVLHIDFIIIRLSGKSIPQQFKSSYLSIKIFKKNYEKFFIKHLGALPVVVDFPPGMTDWEQKKAWFLKRINNWSGKFKHEEWQLRYSIFFDFKNFPEFGSFRSRIKLFLRHRLNLVRQNPNQSYLPQLT